LTTQTLHEIFLVFALLSGAMLLISIFLFYKLNIAKAFGDVTGRSARKAVEQIRKQNTRIEQEPMKTETQPPCRIFSADLTAVIGDGSEITTILYDGEEPEDFAVEEDITFVHTKGIITTHEEEIYA